MNVSHASLSTRDADNIGICAHSCSRRQGWDSNKMSVEGGSQKPETEGDVATIRQFLLKIWELCIENASREALRRAQVTYK